MSVFLKENVPCLRTDSILYWNGNQPYGNVTNSHLEDDSLTINTGTGLSGGGSVELGRSRTISHGDTSSVSNSSNSGNTFIKNITFTILIIFNIYIIFIY